jgi:hypothetical protein
MIGASGPDRVADALDVGPVGLLGPAEVLPAELEGGEAGLLVAGGLLARLDAVRSEQGRGVGRDLGLGRAAEQRADREPAALPLMSHRAMSTPLIAWSTAPRRP